MSQTQQSNNPTEKPLIFITGAAGGIGNLVVADALKAGYRVGALDLSGEALEARSAEWGEDVRTSTLDATDPSAVRETVSALVSELGVPYGLLNIAGNNRIKSLPDLDDDDWRFLIDVNLSSTFYMCRSVIPLMAAAGGGRVINTSSIFGLRGSPRDAAYCAAKAGVVGLTKSLALEYASAGVLVNNVAPVATLTERVAKMPPEHLSGELARIPLGRFSEPSDLSSTFMFLLSEASAFYTGQTFSPNGGDWMP
jgi:3-oxoacyl-[acyl-carrier protein] reductase